MQQRLARIVGSNAFQHFITAVILFAAILVGIETSPRLVASYGPVLHLLDGLVLAIFVAEIALRMGAEGSRPWRYFHDPWNVFDFLIVAVVFLPIGGGYATVLRLARLLRVLRVVRAVPRLQILVGALLHAIPSMGYVALLLFLVFYMYAVSGVFLFGQNDPFRFGDLPRAFLTLFQVATGDEWVQTLNIQRFGCDQFGYEGREALCTRPSRYALIAPVYFVSFTLIGTMVILNLFIGVIMSGMDEAQKERLAVAEVEARESDALTPAASLVRELRDVETELARLSTAVRTLAARARTHADDPS